MTRRLNRLGRVTGPGVVIDRLVLSVFQGIDLLGMGFELEGFTVLHGPELIYGGDVRNWRAPAGVFEGVIGGPPCQDFSRAKRDGAAKRDRPGGRGEELVLEFGRIARDSAGVWLLCENVPGVTELRVDGFEMQRFTVTAREVGNRQIRNRMIQFGSRDGSSISVERDHPEDRSFEPCVMASEGSRVTRRLFEECCELQGLSRGTSLPSFTLEGAYRAIGNAVPLDLARALARAVTRRATEHGPRCICGCGRDSAAEGLAAGPSCRKRLQRRRGTLLGK